MRSVLFLALLLLAVLVAAVLIPSESTPIPNRPEARQELPAVKPPDPVAIAPARFRLVGRVVDADGRAIPGAEVEAVPRLRRWETAGEIEPERTTTDEAGRFRLPGTAAPEYGVLARKAGVGSGSRSSVPAFPESEVVVTLICGVALGGVVVDERGGPVAGARVALDPADATGHLDRRASQHAPSRRREVEGRTDHAGRFRIGDLEPGSYDLTIRADGKATRRRPGTRAPDENLRIVLGDGGALEGTIVRRGATGPGEIALEQLEPTSVTHTLEAPGPVTRFRLAGLWPRRYRLRAVSFGFVTTGATAWVLPGMTTRVDLVLEPGIPVQGLVFDASTGDALPDVAIEFGDDRTAYAFFNDGAPAFVTRGHTRTDASGRFAVRLSPGAWRIRDLEPDWLCTYTPGSQGLSGVPAEPGVEFRVRKDPVEVPVPLAPARAIEGRVLDARGHPLRGRSVWLDEIVRGPTVETEGYPRLPERPKAATGPDGRFRLEPGPWREARLHVHVWKGKPFVKNLARGDLPDGTDLVLRPEEDEVPVEREAPPSVQLHGRVIRSDGKPVADAHVQATPPWQAFVLETTTGPDGRFILQVPGPEARPWTLQVRTESWTSASQSTRPGRPVKFELPVVSSLLGTITHPGPPPEDLTMDLLDRRSASTPRLTWHRQTGTFRLHGVLVGESRLRIAAPGAAPALLGPIRIAAGEPTDLGTIELTTGGSIAGRLVRPDGSSPGKRSLCHSCKHWSVHRLSDAAGRFRLDLVPAGRWHILVKNPRGDSAFFAEVREGEVTSVDWEVP